MLVLSTSAATVARMGDSAHSQTRHAEREPSLLGAWKRSFGCHRYTILRKHFARSSGKQDVSQGFVYDLVSVAISSSWNDMSVYVVVLQL